MEGLKIIFIDLHATQNISDTSTRDIFLSLSRAYIVIIAVAHSLLLCTDTLRTFGGNGQFMSNKVDVREVLADCRRTL